MTDVRIQDFGENSRPNANDEFMMIFNDNSEAKTRLRDAFMAWCQMENQPTTTFLEVGI